MNTYSFDRYRRGVRKAEGGKVRANSEEEARVKVAKLFYEPGDEYLPWYPEEYRLRKVEMQ